MTTIREYAGELVVNRCWCGIQHAVPSSLAEEQQRQRDRGETQLGIFCPLGHRYVLAGKSRVQVEREARQAVERQLACERARHDQTRADRDAKEAQRRAEKAAKTRIKNRISAGVCPCCRRNFVNLGKHLRGQHPEFVAGAKD